MTIQEVIKSGKPFRRIAWDSEVYLLVDKVVRIFVFEDYGNHCGESAQYFVTTDDIIADDWELKPEWRIIPDKVDEIISDLLKHRL